MLQQLQRGKTVCPNKQQAPLKGNNPKKCYILPNPSATGLDEKCPTETTHFTHQPQRDFETTRNSLVSRFQGFKVSRNVNSSLNYAWSPFWGSVAPGEVAKVRPLTFTWQREGDGTCSVSAPDRESAGWVWAFAFLLKSQLKPSIFIISLRNWADVKIIKAVTFLI